MFTFVPIILFVKPVLSMKSSFSRSFILPHRIIGTKVNIEFLQKKITQILRSENEKFH